MIFDDQGNSDTWCKYEAGVEVLIRPLTKDDYRECQKKATKKIRSFEKGRSVVSKKVDEALLDKLLYRHMVRDWKGIFNPAGNPLPCTDEIKDKIFNRLLSFAAWVSDMSAELADDLAMEREEDLKNFASSQDGNSADQEE